MKVFLPFKTCLLCLLLAGCVTTQHQANVQLPLWMKGKFTDDYNIAYTITDSLFVLEPSAKYHILKWDKDAQYLLTKNDTNNKTDKGLYTRIDYMQFTGMEPYTWGFCLTVYDAKDTMSALQIPAAERSIPKKGCNGYPFSRMKQSKP